jgi:hypothetical protein
VKWQVCGVWLWCDIGTCKATISFVFFLSLILTVQPILKLSFNYVIFGFFFFIIFSILLLLLSFLYLATKYCYYCYNL